MRVRKDRGWRTLESSFSDGYVRMCPYCGVDVHLLADVTIQSAFCWKCPRCRGHWDVIFYIDEGGRQRAYLETHGA